MNWQTRFLLLALAFHAIWWLVGLWLVRAIRRLHEPGEKQANYHRQQRRISYAHIIHLYSSGLFLLALLAVQHFFGYLPPLWPAVAWQYLQLICGALIAPNLLFAALFEYLIWAVSLELGRSGRTGEIKSVLVRSLPVLLSSFAVSGAVTSWLMRPAISQFELATSSVAFYALFILSGLLARWQSSGKSSATFLIEPCPLHSEILRLAEVLDTRIDGITITPRRTSSEAQQGRVDRVSRMAGWLRGFRLPQPWLPVEVLQDVSPDALTAGLASMMTNLKDRDLAPRRRQLAGLPEWSIQLIQTLAIFAVIAFLYPIFMFVGWLLGDLVYETIGVVVLFGILFVLILAPGILFLWRHLVVRRLITYPRRRRQHIRTAFEAWRAADPAVARTEEDFLLALLEFNRAVSPTQSPEQIRDTFVRLDVVESFFEELDQLDPAESARLRQCLQDA
ncbi:hypothetical protein ACFL34_01335 [Candidatus Sumerlaeota bacterium]